MINAIYLQLAIACKLIQFFGCSGYMSPEYTIDGLFSTKSDVYSFGVLVLEIVSGKRNRGFTHSDHNLNLLGHVKANMMFYCFCIPR